MPGGIIYLVGAGPGDPGLLTLRGSELLARADVVVYDYLVNDRLLHWCSPQCEKIYVGKEPGFHSISQEEIHHILLQQAEMGKKVVRLKGGDPFVFGRGGEEISRLTKAGVKFEIVPGVTAALAAAAATGIPLTHREHSSAICFLTGHEDPKKERLHVRFSEFASPDSTLCLYMSIGHLGEIAADLIAGGRSPDTPTAVVQWAGAPYQKSILATLSTIANRVETARISHPAIVIVGSVANYYRHHGWFENRPLFGKRIVLTRAPSQNAEWTPRLEETGAQVLELPLISSAPSANLEIAKEVLAGLGSYEWILFTSANGVRYFFEIFLRVFDDLRSLGFSKIGVVGKATESALRAFHIRPELVSKVATGEGLAEELMKLGSIENLKILVVTGNRNRDTVVQRLESVWAMVDAFPVYETSLNDLSESREARVFREQGADVIVFASPSAVHAFKAQASALQLEEGARRPQACSIGPTTSQALQETGIGVTAEATEPNIDGVLRALLECLNPKSLH